jgi:hypothetical protein
VADGPPDDDAEQQGGENHCERQPRPDAEAGGEP